MRPHDLLRLRPGATLLSPDIPAWVARSLARAPFVVVRRGERHADRIPVGVRGELRAQRHPALLHLRDVAETITPEALALARGWRAQMRTDVAAFAALDRVATAMASLELSWGPGGSVGFELASGIRTAHTDSDLDLIVRPASRHTRDDLLCLRERIGDCDVRIDIALEAAQGSVALDEWLRMPQRTLIKTARGPQLGVFVW